jgi:hypothetical protein
MQTEFKFYSCRLCSRRLKVEIVNGKEDRDFKVFEIEIEDTKRIGVVCPTCEKLLKLIIEGK